jgi:hypothetical protein
MALTAAQRVIVFEILDVTPSKTMGLMVDPDRMATYSISYGDRPKSTADYIDAQLTWIAANDAALENRLIEHIQQWENIGTDPSSQTGGAVGALTGISDDPTSELRIIRGRVENIIGIREWNEKRSNRRDPGTQFMSVIAG